MALSGGAGAAGASAASSAVASSFASSSGVSSASESGRVATDTDAGKAPELAVTAPTSAVNRRSAPAPSAPSGAPDPQSTARAPARTGAVQGGAKTNVSAVALASSSQASLDEDADGWQTFFRKKPSPPRTQKSSLRSPSEVLEFFANAHVPAEHLDEALRTIRLALRTPGFDLCLIAAFILQRGRKLFCLRGPACKLPPARCCVGKHYERAHWSFKALCAQVRDHPEWFRDAPPVFFELVKRPSVSLVELAAWVPSAALSIGSAHGRVASPQQPSTRAVSPPKQPPRPVSPDRSFASVASPARAAPSAEPLPAPTPSLAPPPPAPPQTSASVASLSQSSECAELTGKQVLERFVSQGEDIQRLTLAVQSVLEALKRNGDGSRSPSPAAASSAVAAAPTPSL